MRLVGWRAGPAVWRLQRYSNAAAQRKRLAFEEEEDDDDDADDTEAVLVATGAEFEEDVVLAGDVEAEARPHWQDMRDALMLELEDKRARTSALLDHFPPSTAAAVDPIKERTAVPGLMVDPIAQPLARIEAGKGQLLSKYDWRLSSPLIRRRSSERPPDLKQAMSSTTAWSGFNRLVGVGLAPALESRRSKRPPPPPAKGKAKAVTVEEESWGWKTAVPPSENQPWEESEPYVQRMTRLLDLTWKADEAMYLDWLKKRGSPEQRQQAGITICEATGSKLAASSTSSKNQGIMTVWQRADDFPIELGENCWFELERPLRFTPTDDSTGGTLDARQGVLVDTRDGKLIVAFEEDWDIESSSYRIDVGLDDAAIKLQRRALANLLYDPVHQATRNRAHVESAQRSFQDGIVTPLREWTLQGTALRHRLVPAEEGAAAAADTAAAVETARPLFRDNQLINSWIMRHDRDVPVTMLGDPDLGLNRSQLRAVAMALRNELSLIQGPPGTGKSATIVSLIKLLKRHFRVPEPILLAAPTHVSTDHLLSMLVEAGLCPLRIGKADRVNPDLRQWTIEQRRTEHPLWSSSEDARLEAELSRIERNRAQDEVKHAKSPIAEKRAKETYELADARYRQAVRKAYVFEHRLLSSLMTTADVFLGTTIGAGSSTALRVVDFPIVIIDEAAMCTEPATLLPMMKGAQHVTLIGDHMQLPAVVVDKTAQQEKLHVSMFERLMRTASVPSTLLNTQYRMRPIISGFPNFAFYDSELEDDASVSNRPTRLRSSLLTSESEEACVFVSHGSAEAYGDRSMHNRGEALLIHSIVRDLLQLNPALSASSIGIISPYAGQTKLLRDLFNSSSSSSTTAGRSNRTGFGTSNNTRTERPVDEVEINTVDGFQGREKDVVILSTVRSNKKGHIGFLTDKRRLNVALTRARDALFVVGNETTLRKAKDVVSVNAVIAQSSDANNGNGSSGTTEAEGNENADAGMWSLFLDWMSKRGLVKYWHQSPLSPQK